MSTDTTHPQSDDEPNERIIDADLAEDLDDAVDALEETSWGDVPGVGAESASAFAVRLDEAREQVLNGVGGA